MRTVLLVAVLLPLSLAAQSDKKKPADGPKLLQATPFGVEPGKKVKVVLRGQKLDGAKDAKLSTKGTAKVLKASATEVEVEVELPADVEGDDVTLRLTAAGGDTPPHTLCVDRVTPVAEKEPNDGLARAQPVKVGQTVHGKIDRAQDVDVYRFDAAAGQKVVIEVHAARLGSPLDSYLTLYDAAGQVVAICDDIAGSTDSRIAPTLAAAGAYRVSVADVHDQGGPTYAYRLSIRPANSP